MIETCARTDVGRVRAHNEDGVLCEPVPSTDAYLLAVADGMGGHHAGEVASRVAVRALSDEVRDAWSADEAGARETLAAAVAHANREVHRTAETRPECDGMGTTLVAALVDEEVAVVANVGDSRAYLVDEREIRQVTEDHTLVGELLSEGVLTETEAVAHPQQHVLSRALGTAADVRPDLFVEPMAGRTLLLCSDGLTGELDDAAIKQSVARPAPLESIAADLVRRANERGGRDNTSVVLARRVPGG